MDLRRWLLNHHPKASNLPSSGSKNKTAAAPTIHKPREASSGVALDCSSFSDNARRTRVYTRNDAPSEPPGRVVQPDRSPERSRRARSSPASVSGIRIGLRHQFWRRRTHSSGRRTIAPQPPQPAATDPPCPSDRPSRFRRGRQTRPRCPVIEYGPNLANPSTQTVRRTFHWRYRLVLSVADHDPFKPKSRKPRSE